MAELLRLMTHSSNLEDWQEEGRHFYHLLRTRGYPQSFLLTVFKEVTWARRKQILQRTKQKDNGFFEIYKACVLTLRNAPEWTQLKEILDLRLTELVDSTVGDIFPKKAFLAQRNAPRLGSILKKTANQRISPSGGGSTT